MTTSIIGYPRIGRLRELKFATEKFFKQTLDEAELLEIAKKLRQEHWTAAKNAGIQYIPSNDFSFYDTTLDTAVALNIIPERYQKLPISTLERYFALARGYQGEHGDVKALSMKKWFNTNYHYMVPEFEDTTQIQVNLEKLLTEYREAKALGIITKPVLVGPYTLLKLIKFTGEKQLADIKATISESYSEIIRQAEAEGIRWLQFDEPALVFDLKAADIQLFTEIYQPILNSKKTTKLLLQTYFGDIRDIYETVISLDFDGIGLDFIEGRQSIDLVKKYGFPAEKQLFAGVVNGKNIWVNNYQNTINLLNSLPSKDNIVISSSCSLQHVPYAVNQETELENKITEHFAFAEEKLIEIKELAQIFFKDNQAALADNQILFNTSRFEANLEVQNKIENLVASDFQRSPAFEQRESIQKEVFKLPLLPTTTIGSFPQTAEVRKNRLSYKRGEISWEKYEAFNHQETEKWIRIQEKIDLDVLVHGEFERNDMVEYFGEKLAGYVFTRFAWVQSYGTRCVKPPIVWGDIARIQPLSVADSVYAQSLTDKVVKGMLTGPVTILNWSFPREDISLKTSTLQIALAIQEEVIDLESHGIKMIQIDEAALREKLPLRRTDWNSEYLDWAIPAFRLVHSKVQPETQIHTHMCYSEFEDIIEAIDAMDADVISFEASRSDLSILDALKDKHFRTQVGPGVYDIHSPRIPSAEEIGQTIARILEKVPAEKLWINPDCGLKTRGQKEVVASLENLVSAAKEARKAFKN
ncbi:MULTISPECIES: 5-methyltetrahydropteroyltriglutamate--homocysteine S-methyltransferase [unclassified Enterococcus]|uniref:5-methyltetrahydropteroyltriglutamate-- homocysteine S-methyltransferase n=1 Tax=unclassified Enterococcus TaxID=2608891 RepID=UPI0015544A71|nr:MULTISPECIES: 5-methyltetrahydropteroyltriglutamate--homocysteine S-methyltransferase [unclassified Enterococcus]MBS7578045.1 5-methyltetrahydropteroyltriglutamate--homocysteine S-methyltransferase [Enterococcus sp. MMGLQ5-2]MBS7585265.1 5-methyltetrahydropteroyltriglutamate--homocysteine S-methyltransferase [Enterococcus sp. MMGLQ5-1]NPD13122.1 5-methyltetrahydropteroyltriglutamate--homocysteine S-methyltransferase [Enterococcus sp. MMGLQ5-1]NPD37876.1 5-methyltetrahydropteroyltriglutamate-